eukprot:3603921-Rhodomonas_salina.2
MDYTFKSHELSAELSQVRSTSASRYSDNAMSLAKLLSDELVRQEWLGSLHTAIEDSLLNHNVRRVETRSNWSALPPCSSLHALSRCPSLLTHTSTHAHANAHALTT